ncbi:polysaccharide biosynthesis protein [Tsukamurella pulmonis]|uniref:Glycosyltransferase involved in cell wall bisynthesis n=1 Tax=Tsukamurella pulmonis TaxID=47312 RepID=A0A1H1HWB7_9ACTN|nr:glycosyltransferase family 4 protein [Tsukamurella pulmonis]KXO94284.1 glycosyl transferase [Tsukamurella pulmonis]BDD80356.1 polysaccharide biosynthesis protein [Tsukamurella pulmonis]SDR29713.1 Glycosyltransferase involved in cell wall bisynthesis [Tsukamurella pulmonis]SUP12906.1 Glycogen synthase [Tsukamurella pulmonis]
MTAPTRVLVVGPAAPGPASRGGIATVVGHMAAQPDPAIAVRLLTTYVDGTVGQRLRTGLGGMARGVLAVLRGEADVVHVHLSHGGSVVRKAPVLWAARLRRVPAVVHGHSYDFGGWVTGLPAPARPLVRAALPADRWLVLGTGLATEYAAAMGLPRGDVEVLYNPVPAVPARAAAAPPDGVVRVVALGRLGERKGSYDLVAAVAALPPEIRARLHLTLAGDGEVDEVRAAVAAAGVGDAVTVRGWVDAAGRDELLAAAQVFALPSYDEGLPMALLEAMAAGLAPLTTPVGAIPDAVTDGADALLVPPGDVPALSAALARLVTDPALRAAISAGARTRADDFAIEPWHARLAALWIELAAEGGPAATRG